MRSRDYGLVTAGYWAFTLTDGALRMLVLLYFHELGYSPVSIAFLFLLYECMGVATNLLGGWLGARAGLHRTLLAGLALQIVALVSLTFHRPSWPELVAVGYVMGVQALSGVAKDLTKMSSKSAVKHVAVKQTAPGDGAPGDGAPGDGALFRLVALLTGSKNALKGAGFFVGAALLGWLGFDGALWALAGVIVVALVSVATLLDSGLGRIDDGSKKSPLSLRSVLSPSSAVNRLAAARLFLFGSRDIWFVVALPVFLADEFGWSFEGIGGFLAAWVIGYGAVQSATPRVLRATRGDLAAEVGAARTWALALAAVSAAIAVAVAFELAVTVAVVGGLVVFGLVFALNSSLHSYLILAFGRDDDVSLDVGFYYSANAAGRLIGTLLSGVLALIGGLEAALWGSTAFVAVAWLLTLRLPSSRPAIGVSTAR